MFLNEGEKENFLIRESFGIKLKKKKRKKEEEEEEERNRERECWMKPRTFLNLNEGDKENKRRGIETRTTCGGEKQEEKKKKTYG